MVTSTSVAVVLEVGAVPDAKRFLYIQIAPTMITNPKPKPTPNPTGNAIDEVLLGVTQLALDEAPALTVIVFAGQLKQKVDPVLA